MGNLTTLRSLSMQLNRFNLVANVANKSAKAVTAATISLLMPYKDTRHTITVDNRKEFGHHEQLSEALSAVIYFSHPYHP